MDVNNLFHEGLEVLSKDVWVVLDESGQVGAGEHGVEGGNALLDGGGRHEVQGGVSVGWKRMGEWETVRDHV